MPYYKIIITLKNGKQKTGIRQLELRNIDMVHLMILKKVNVACRESDVKSVDVYMLSKHSREIKVGENYSSSL